MSKRMTSGRRRRPSSRWRSSRELGPRAWPSPARPPPTPRARPPTLPDGTSSPRKAVQDPANISAPGEVAPGVRQRPGRHGPQERLHQRHPRRRPRGLPARRAGHRLRRRLLQPRVAADRGDRPRRVQPRPLRRQHAVRRGRLHARDHGIPLNGSNGTQRITDTDAGECDRDKNFDRAVGPMQFIPSTWRSSASTATATASATRRTSTTPPWRPRSTSAPATRTSASVPARSRRSSATTTARTT